MIENEYKKIWGKDNYTILKELQKVEMMNYIQQLKQENPEYIYNLRQKAIIEEQNIINMLNWEDLWELKSDTFITWNSWALLTLIEFSDLECPYCITYHNEGTINSVLEQNKDQLNYIFKNFPLPIHKNSKKEALAWKCIEKLSNWENYLNYVDTVFQTTKWGWEWYDLENIKIFIKDVNISEEDFDNCFKEEKNLKLVEKEFEHGRKLWITSTPSTVIINNTTGEYMILSWSVEVKELEEVINILKK